LDKNIKVTQKVTLAISDQTLASHNSAADWARGKGRINH